MSTLAVALGVGALGAVGASAAQAAAGTTPALLSALTPSGQIRVIDPRPPMGKDYSFVSLEGVTYLP